MGLLAAVTICFVTFCATIVAIAYITKDDE